MNLNTIPKSPLKTVEGYTENNLPRRHRTAMIWSLIFQVSTIIGIVALTALLYNITNQSFGYVAIQNKVDPASLVRNGKALEEQTKEELIATLEENISKNLFRKLGNDKPWEERSELELQQLIQDNVIKPQVKGTWTLTTSIFRKAKVEAELAAIREKNPEVKLVFMSWLNPRLFNSPQSSDALKAGVRTAILGSLFTILITILVAFPVGVSAAIYLEEYASDNWINRVIQTNINNLAGVPSIIYGMLGLAIFVRTLEPLTSGAVFGLVEPGTANGRTILSAGLTLAILILPLLIINAQEAIRTVPDSLRQASYGVGATKWQTIWHHVLPNAIPGILTGTILSISRAMGETAPLVVVGASTFIDIDPSGPFSKFTTLPIQIYQWSVRPQPEFRNLAAAAIVILMILLLSLNATAILFRNRFSRRLM